MLALNNVEVIYNEVILVLKGMSMQVPEGKIVGLLGSNGAGKSTTIKMLSGILVPSGGSVEVQGQLKFREPKPVSEAIKFITLLEDNIGKIRGVRRVKIDFQDWDKSNGKWGRALEEPGENK